MAKTYEELMAGATQIKNNELPESNTHSLVGGQLLDMVEKQKEDSERIDNVSKSHKGYFQTLEQLKAKYPSPKDGETAWVGEPYPGNVYDVVDGAWHDTGVPAQEGSGGGGGTTDYNALDNKPSINNVTLEGDKTLEDLGIASKESVESIVVPKVDASLSTTSVNTIQNKVVTAEINKINEKDTSQDSRITSQDSQIAQIQTQVNGLSGINSPFIGYFGTSSNLPSVSSACWALVGDLASVKPYAYYTTAPSGFSAGWNDLSGTLGTYDFTVLTVLEDNIGLLSFEEFLESKDYAKGSVVLYEGDLKKFSANHNKGAWSGSDVRNITLRSMWGRNINSLQLSQGGFNYSTDANVENTVRLRTTYFDVESDLYISVNSDYQIAAINTYDKGDNFIGGISINAQSYTLAKTAEMHYARVSIKRADESSIRPTDDIGLMIKSSPSSSYTKTNYEIFLERGWTASSGRIGSADDTDIKTRATSPNYIRLKKNLNEKISINTGDYEYTIRFYDANLSLLSHSFSTWQPSNTEFSVPNNCVYAKVLVRKSDNSNLPNIIKCYINSIVFDIDGEIMLNTNLGTNPVNTDGNINIKMVVDVINADCNNNTTTSIQATSSPYTTYGLLKLPSSYKNTGKPTPLLVFCHGYSGHYASTSTEIASTSNLNVDYLLAEGFAVMDMDGNPLSINKPHACSSMGIECYIKGIKWVQDRYNVTKHVYLAGHSMGGMMAMLLSTIGNAFQIKAVCAFAPATSIIQLMQLHPEDRDAMANYYGFEGAKPSWGSSSDLTEVEKTYIFSNIEKVMKGSTLWTYSNVLPEEITSKENKFLSPPTEDENSLYKKKHKIIPHVPIKIFQGDADASCLIGWNDILVQMLRNAGANVEYRVMSGVVHTGTGGITAVGSNNVVTDSGEEFSGAPTPLVEMVRFFRQY